MFTIYGRANSSNVRKVLWLCAELGIEEYERLDYGRGYKDCASPEYVALNPNKQVPTLVDGDLVLWESNTILRYLAAKQGRDDLYPADIVARAKVDMWMDWQLSILNEGMRLLFMGLQVKDPAFTSAESVNKGREMTNRSMAILDAHLATTGGYAAAANLTISDCAIGMYVHRWYALPVERPALGNLAAYYVRLKERGPFQEWIVGQGV